MGDGDTSTSWLLSSDGVAMEPKLSCSLGVSTETGLFLHNVSGKTVGMWEERVTGGAHLKKGRSSLTSSTSEGRRVEQEAQTTRRGIRLGLSGDMKS